MLLQPPSAERRRKRTRGGVDTRCQATVDDVIRYLREQQVTLTYDPAAPALHAENGRAATTMFIEGKLIRPEKVAAREEARETDPPVARHWRKPAPG
jgi:hypothetical protein